MSKLVCMCFWALVVYVVQGYGFSLPAERLPIVRLAMGKMLACEFDSVFSLCDSVIASDRRDPLGEMLKLSAMAFLDLDCNHVSDSIGFHNQFQKTEAAVFSYETNNGKSSYSLTIKGFSKAISACYFLWHKSYMKGLNTGFDALSVLKEAKKIDPANTDVELFLGLYNYARADMKRMFWWAFFWYPGDKESGIRSLVVSRKSGQFTQPVATIVLAELSIREKKYQEAGTVIAELLRDYPKSRLTRWTQAKYFEEQKKNLEAAEIYRGLADEYDTIPIAWRNSLAARLKEATMLDGAGAREQTEIACRRILSKKKDHSDSVTRQIIKDAEKLLETKKRAPKTRE
jgi:tetratricopeptide (TPR) repeat protein